MLLWRLLKRRLVGIPDVILTVQAKEAIAAVLKDVLDDLDDENAEGQFSNGSKALLNGPSSCNNLSLHRTWLVTSTTSLAWGSGVV